MHATSRQHINAYRNRLAKLHAVSGSLNEGVVSDAFRGLLDSAARAHDLVFVPQWESHGARGPIRIDGALVPNALRVPFGYWEAKDSKDDLDAEIADKRAKGYPDDNIIYENSVTAVLRQNGREVARAPLQGDDDAIIRLLDLFFAHESERFTEFRRAAAQFRADLPQILAALREAILQAERENSAYAAAAADFLSHAREAINPAVTPDDVREMLIQHILTEDIFNRVFDDQAFHRENNVAKRLGELEAKFLTGSLRHATTQKLAPYYNAIKSAATGIADRRAKQTFLKRLYEDFYKVYNPKAADRLGVVYTPNEIVRFMIRGADWLCEKHFGKCLIDPGVEILDPATGTGTFIVELLEHFAGDPDKLRHKYKEELHANEVAILPYYVANLNIEATYAAITGQYAEFPGLVFVDTLDNTAGLGMYAGYQGDLLGGMSDENIGRIKRQNDRKISVVIGNPPYNAWSSDYNARNPNRPYKRIDDRIGATYRALSSATNTSALSDMYVRFFRWASDRLRDDGILAFVCNRNFIEKLAFDGFRRSVAQEFQDILLVDLGGDVRANPKLSGTTHNVFGIQTGVTIAFMVKRAGKGKCTIRYARRPEDELAREKLDWLDAQEPARLESTALSGSSSGIWLNQGAGAWEELLPLADSQAGPQDAARPVSAIMRLMSQGVQTKRDDWLLAASWSEVRERTEYFIEAYNRSIGQPDETVATDIKWCRELDRKRRSGRIAQFEIDKIVSTAFRPFTRRFYYFDTLLSSMTFKLPHLYAGQSNQGIIASKGMRAPFSVFAADLLPSGDYWVPDAGFVFTRHRYTKSGERVDNITDWALAQFRQHYADPPLQGEVASRSDDGGVSPSTPAATITKDDIFAYCYAVLHDPIYRETYAADLRRFFPRIPFYPDFHRWAAWGRTLLDLHINYESAEPHPITRTDAPPHPAREGRLAARRAGVGDPTPAAGKPAPAPTPKLKSHPAEGRIVIDSETQLTGIPPSAWNYRLGNRSAIDWVLDQHKEKTPRDPTIRERFNTYRFADHKGACIDLLARVVTVSLETNAITRPMREAPRA